MNASDLASQLPYVLAPVLIVSALLKRIMQLKDDGLEVANATDGRNISVQSVLNYLKKDLAASRMIWRVEILLAAGIILTSRSDGMARNVTHFSAVLLFSSFFALCLVDLIRKEKKPCLCFGALSKKPARPISCIRNAFLAIGALFAALAEPSNVSIVGLFVCACVLMVILYEEIR